MEISFEDSDPSCTASFSAAKSAVDLGAGAFDEIGEQGSHLAGLLIPFFPWTERFIIVLRKQDVDFAFWDKASESFSGLTAVSVVIAGNDASGYFDRP